MTLPVPEPDTITRFHWDAATAGKLVVQRCNSCRMLQYPPDLTCLQCQGEAFDHVEVSGRGTIYSYVVADRPLHAGFVDRVPYVVVLVELVEQPGLRILTNLVGVRTDQPVECGLPVEVDFEDRGGVTMPQFRLVRERS